MNKFQKAGLAVIAACGMSFAYGDLWGTNDERFASLQVQYPQVRECWADPAKQPNEGNNWNSPCYNETAGWFYGYAENGGSTLHAYIGDEWVNFGSAPSPQLTDAMGASKIGPGFRLRYYAGPTEGDTKPGLAAFGANLRVNDKLEGDNVAARGGICVYYQSDEDIKLELGWDEAAYNYNTFQANLPAAPTGRMIDLSWDAASVDRTSGDFSRETWAPTHPISAALESLRSIKFPLKNTGIVGINAEFALRELGWKGTCSATGSLPTLPPASILPRIANANVNVNLTGRMLSVSVNKPTSVQIINLQGALVHNQVYTSDTKGNLSNLPTGVYVVRIPSLGYTNRVILK